MATGYIRNANGDACAAIDGNHNGSWFDAEDYILKTSYLGDGGNQEHRIFNTKTGNRWITAESATELITAIQRILKDNIVTVAEADEITASIQQKYAAGANEPPSIIPL